MIAAILKAQWLSMRPRTRMQRGGAMFTGATGLLFYGFWAVGALGVMALLASTAGRAELLARLAAILMLATVYWQVAPVVSASVGASLELKKLLVYPVPRGKLFTVEVLLRVTSCAEMLIILCGVAAGVARNPAGARGTLTILAAAGFAGVNVLLAAGMRNLLERMFTRARFKELTMLLLVAVTLAPQVMLLMNVRVARVVEAVPAQVGLLWGATARLMLGDARGLLVLMLYLAAAYGFARWQFWRAIRYDAGPAMKAASARQSAGIMEAIYRLPGKLLRDPVGALVEKEIRSLARIPRVRFVYAMSCVFGIVIYLPALRAADKESFYLQNALPVMGLYGLLMLGQVSYWNSFGFDKSAAQGYYWWPVRFRDVLMAKNVAVLTAIVPQLMLITLAGSAAGLPVSGAKLVEAMVVIPVTSLYWFTFGNYFSVRTPRAMDADKMNQMSSKLQALSIWTAPVTLLPVGLAYWARVVFGSQWVFAGMMGIAAAVGAVLYVIGLESVEQMAYRKREEWLGQLSQGGGPMAFG